MAELGVAAVVELRQQPRIDRFEFGRLVSGQNFAAPHAVGRATGDSVVPTPPPEWAALAPAGRALAVPERREPFVLGGRGEFARQVGFSREQSPAERKHVVKVAETQPRGLFGSGHGLVFLLGSPASAPA